MTATLSQVQQALENSKSSILFMQQEHAKTLQGLYGEISKLQKKCGELTFQIAMRATSTPQSEGELKDHVVSLEKEMKVLRSDNTELKSLLESKDKKIFLIDGQLKSQERSFKEELKSKTLKIQTLNSELEQKSGTIAYLTTQLHQIKVKQTGKVSKSETRERSATRPEVSITPTPPTEGLPAGSARRRPRKSLSSTTAQEVTNLSSKADRQPVANASEMVLNIEPAKSNRGLPSRPKRTSPIHPSYKQEKDVHSTGTRYRPPPSDYTEIIRASAKPEMEVVVKPTPNPLPPIAPRDDETVTPRSSYTRKVHISRGGTRVVYPGGQEVDSVLTEDVGTIIVQSPMNSPDKGWRHVQDTNSSE